MGFHTVMAKDLMDHLIEKYGNIQASSIDACRQALVEYIEVHRPIFVYFQRMEDTINFSQEGNMLFIHDKIVQSDYFTVNKKSLYSMAPQGLAEESGHRSNVEKLQASLH